MTASTELDTSAARQLTDRIKVAVEGTWLLIQEAYTCRAWAALSYDSWDAYLDAEFGSTRLALPREERAETVLSMRQSGMSVRAIGAATGLGTGTVHREIANASVPDGTVADRLIGLDGRERAATRQKPPIEPICPASDDWAEPDDDFDELLAQSSLETPRVRAVLNHAAALPEKTKRRPLPEAFAEASLDLTKAAERLTRLTQDDRFNRNRDQTHHQMPALITALEHTAALIQAMDLTSSTANEEARRWWAASLIKNSDALRDVANTLPKEQ